MKNTGHAAYCIYDNKTLDSMIKTKPQNIKELSEIKGIGKKKCQSFGKQVTHENIKFF